MENIVQKRINASAEALYQWEEQIINAEEKLTEMENYLKQKDDEYEKAHQDLLLVEDRIERFEKLVSFFEQNFHDYTSFNRLDSLEAIKNIQRTIDKYSSQIQSSHDNPTTLSDLIWSLSDLMSRFERLRLRATLQ
jgi:chromosome segregation ATPase